MESESKKVSLSKVDKWSQIFMLIGLFATPLFFWPAFGLQLEAVKKIFLAGAIVIALILWFIGRLNTKTLAVPRTILWAIALIFVVVMAISGFVSGSAWSSFLGLGAETGTVYSILIFFGLTFLATEYSLSKQKFAKLYIGILSVFAAAFLFQISRFVFGNYLPWPAFDLNAVNLIGKWNDFGIFAGLVALSTTVMLELFPLKEAKGLKIFLWLSLIVSFLTLALVNFYLLWVVLLFFFLVLFVLNVTIFAKGKKNYFRVSSVMFVITLLFVILGTPLKYDSQGKAHEGIIAQQIRVITEKLKIASLEVRPSWRGTIMVTSSTWKTDALFGVGPNHFSSAWLANKPQGVNDSQFWNIEPEFGVGLIPTLFVTTGLLGGLAVLAFILYLLYLGFKALLSPKIDHLDKSFLLLSFTGAAFGWTILTVYVTQTSIVAFTFALTGLFIARLVDAGAIKLMVQPLAVDPRTKFISAITSIVAGVLLVLVAYGWIASTGSILMLPRAGAAMTKNNPDKALSAIRTAIALNPEDIYYRTAAQINVSQMSTLATKKMPEDEAMKEFAKLFALAKGNVDAAVTANPHNYANYIARGSLYENIMSFGVKGSYDVAKKNYSDALARNPSGPDMNLNLARLEIANNNISAAEKLLEESLKQKKDYIDAIYLQSQLYVQRGFLDSAITRLQYAAQLAPNDAGILFQLGYLKYRNGDYRGAAQAMQSAVQAVPNYANALWFLGLSFDKLGQADKALLAFQAIAQSNPDNPDVVKAIANVKAGRDPLASSEQTQTKLADPAKKK